LPNTASASALHRNDVNLSKKDASIKSRFERWHDAFAGSVCERTFAIVFQLLSINCHPLGNLRQGLKNIQRHRPSPSAISSLPLFEDIIDEHNCLPLMRAFC
jgi:hypothetical protein